MESRWRKAALAAVTFAAVATRSGHADSANDAQLDQAALATVPSVTTEDLCAEAPPGFRRCFAKRVVLPAGQYQPFSPQGFGPSDLRAAYGLPASGGAGRIVAIVDAMDAPNAESDLAAYRSAYGLPPCTTANGCFTKVNQSGQRGSYPSADSGWAGEIALDLDMVSAVCPDCKILLVEADSASNADLGTAVNTAASMGAVAISNSYGGAEDSSARSDDTQYYNHPGILITASSGDSSYSAGASFPASGSHVLAVGGTTLARSSSSRGWAERAWSSGGSGCSRYIGKPSFQADPSCSGRMVADVSAVGDPASGVSVYDGGWQVVGGTSASSPIVASIFALLGLAGSTNGFPYAHASAFYDVTSGANGSCATTYFCNAVAGYDGPTGIGTPNGAVLATINGTPPPPPPPPDSGAPSPPPQDSGVPIAADSGAPGGDAGAPRGADGGYAADAGADDGDGSSSPGADAATRDDGGTNADDWVVAPPSGCACNAHGERAPDAGAGALLVLAALFVRRRR